MILYSRPCSTECQAKLNLLHNLPLYNIFEFFECIYMKLSQWVSADKASAVCKDSCYSSRSWAGAGGIINSIGLTFLILNLSLSSFYPALRWTSLCVTPPTFPEPDSASRVPPSPHSRCRRPVYTEYLSRGFACSCDGAVKVKSVIKRGTHTCT